MLIFASAIEMQDGDVCEDRFMWNANALNGWKKPLSGVFPGHTYPHQLILLQ